MRFQRFDFFFENLRKQNQRPIFQKISGKCVKIHKNAIKLN